MAAKLVVGFDLDMTLIDTRRGFAACLQALSEESGVRYDIEAMTARLGPPLEQMLAEYVTDPELITRLADRFRELYPATAVTPTPALHGAHEALAAVRGHRGGTLVVTGKYEPNARLHLDHLGFDVDHLVGWVWGPGKAEHLLRHGASIYVGDHLHDVEGALAAGATSVSVLTGGCSADELWEAGTDVVLDDLGAFPGWLDQHLLAERLAVLEAGLGALGSVMVAYSGGADSAFLLAAAVRALGTDSVVAATGYSPSLPMSERDPAAAFARSLGVRLVTPWTSEQVRAGYFANAPDRCYHCKAELLEVLGPLAQEYGMSNIATGTNADDLVAGFRPGIRAAAERGATTPLADAGLTKRQVRLASRAWGLPTWDKPAAACLASRIAYGIEVTPLRLSRVERAEEAVRAVLANEGIKVANLRVRDLGDVASIEVDPERVAEVSALRLVTEVVCGEGFTSATVDERGFRSGSMNELLPDPERHR